MRIPETVQPFWDRFQASITYDASQLFYEAFHFDDNEPTANALGTLVSMHHPVHAHRDYPVRQRERPLCRHRRRRRQDPALLARSSLAVLL